MSAINFGLVHGANTLKRLFAGFLVTASTSALALPQPVLQVYVRDGCPHCADAKAFLPKFASVHPELKIELRPVDRDPVARDDLIRLSRTAGIWPPSVPTFVYGNRVLVGFDNAERTGSQLTALLTQRSQAPDSMETKLFGTLSADRLGLPLFTLVMGLLDGFNPCATWVLLFLLSLLVHLRERRKMVLVAGTFVLASGAVYYAFMAAWLNLFLFVGMSAVLRTILGGLALFIGAVNIKDYFSFGRGLSLSIPQSSKPGLYARMRRLLQAETLPLLLSGIVGLAIAVNFVELLCTAGFPAIYTAVLTQQHLSLPAHYAYLGLYIVGYIFDDALMVTVAVVALSSFKLTENAGRWLKLLSGGVMLALGMVMMVRPEWLM